jgi:carboxylesterase type B
LCVGILDRTNNKLNFQPSKPHPRYQNTFEANDDSILCPQFHPDNNSIAGTIDCLRLNVYVPINASSNGSLPVMVYFHGGGFMFGASNRYEYGPKYLVRHDVILITVNYRVGVYGFMCLGIPEVPGNQGLKDQVLALKWVKSNIEAFGGDANKITIFGSSAGAHSTDFHLMYGESNLFNNAILQSGGVLSSTVFMVQDDKVPLKIAAHLGFSTNSLRDALTFLSNSDKVIEATVALDLNFKPCVEQTFDDIEPFITRSWINSTTYDNLKNKSLITGFVEFETVGDYIDPKVYENVDVFYNRINSSFNFDEEELTKVKTLLHHFYLGTKNINKEAQFELANFDSDFTHIHPMHRTLERYLDNEAKNVYHYMFSYVGKRNSLQIKNNITLDVAGHTDEIGYLFDPAFIKGEPNLDDQKKIDQMTAMWTNFAKYG